MPDDFDIEGFEADLKETLRKGREGFEGKYKQEVEHLLGLSAGEIARLCPDTTSMKKYDELITVVKEASRVNLAQAQLKQQIERLGVVAVSIARRIPPLARLLG
jgi:hypothetical protein